MLSLQVAMNILNSGRFSMGSAVAGMLKKLIGRYVRDSSPLPHSLAPAASAPAWMLCHVLTTDGAEQNTGQTVSLKFRTWAVV